MSNPIATASNPRVGEDVFGDFDSADYKPDLASAIAAEIMSLKWTHYLPIDDSVEAEIAASGEHCNRYGDVQEVVSAVLARTRIEPHTVLVASTPEQKEGETGATPMGSGSHPSDRTPSGSAGYAVSILRAALVQAVEEQVRYWRERQSHETCPEECMDDDGHYTPMGDDAAIRFGYCNGRLSEADWWLKTLQTMPLPTLPSVRDRSSEAAETSGSAEGKSPAPHGATP